MKRVALALACLLILAASAQPAAAATKKERQRTCAKRGFTVASSKAARVFEVDREGDHSMYGCMRSNGRLQLLSSWFSCDCSVGDEIAPDVELHAGRFAEVTEYASCGPFPEPNCGGSSATLRDLRTRRDHPVQDEVAQVLARGRTFAYADGRVVLVERRTARVVDPGPGIEDGSLAFSRTRLYWMRDGQPNSAPLSIGVATATN
jgi:hypothetical protein